MRIGIDIRPFLKEETGIGIYLKNLLAALACIDRSNEYFLFSSSLRDRFDSRKLPPLSRMVFRDFRFPVKAVNFFWYRLGWPSLDSLFRIRLDLTHSPVPLLLPTRGRKIITIHDLFFLDFPGQAGREIRRSHLRRVQAAVGEADGIITISRYMKGEIEKRFGSGETRISVIPHGLDRVFLDGVPPPRLETTRKKYALPSSFLLFVGAIEPRKNLPRLIDALSLVHERCERIPLVLVGPPREGYLNLMERIRRYGMDKEVLRVGYLEGEELRHLYRLGTVFVLPSLCEGFGLPLLEAMASGIPVAASGVSAIPEVAGEAALYFQPDEVEDMAEKICLLLTDQGLRERLRRLGEERARQFSWENAAWRTLDFYKTVMGN